MQRLIPSWPVAQRPHKMARCHPRDCSLQCLHNAAYDASPSAKALHAALAAALVVAACPGAAEARIKTESMMSKDPQSQEAYRAGFDPAFDPAYRRGTFPGTTARQPPPLAGGGTPTVASRANVALQQLREAQAASDAGRFDEALTTYSSIVKQYEVSDGIDACCCVDEGLAGRAQAWQGCQRLAPEGCTLARQARSWL